VSKTELQRITRRFIHSLGNNIGPDYDIPAPDMGTNSQIMAWAMDTYMNTVGHVSKQSVKGIVTGKPVASGGTLGRDKATGQGVVHCITEWAREKNFDLEGATMSIQGFGNVGSFTAVLLSKLGVSLVAVGDHTGYLYNPEGFNPHKLQDYVQETGSIAGYPNGRIISREEFFFDEGRHFRSGGAREPDRTRRGLGSQREARRRGRETGHATPKASGCSSIAGSTFCPTCSPIPAA